MRITHPRQDQAVRAVPTEFGRDADDAALAELLEYAGMRAEEAVHRWREERRKLNLGLDAYGGACVMMSIDDRRLLNALKRTGVVAKGTYSGTWDVKRTWAYHGQECGVDCAMAEAVVQIINQSLRGRAHAYVHSWWS